jgi:adenylosuccinate lyase
MSAVWSEQAKYETWLQVELAVCDAWAEVGRIPREDAERLHAASFSIDRLNEVLAETHHDMTAFLRAVSETVGPEGRWVHLGLTSSDVMDTGLALQILRALDIIDRGVVRLTTALRAKAREYRTTLAIGRTHGVHAEPTAFGLRFALWADEMERNRTRLEQARQVIAVGKLSGPVGSHATLPGNVEEMACSRLGLQVAPVSTQIIQRDRHAQVISSLAIAAATIEKIALEIRSLQRTEVLEAEEPFDDGQTGSSSMPHKRNPELSERMCGLARVLRGHVVTALENVALWHERDISHSSTERIIFPDAFLLLDYMLDITSRIIERLKVYPNHIQRNVELTRGLVFSQRLLLALIDTGLARHDAYKLVQRNAMRAWAEELDFRDLVRADADITERLDSDALDNVFDYDYFLRNVDVAFERIGL